MSATVTSDELRQRAESLVQAAGHCSPAGSIHECRTCGRRFRRDQLSWRQESFPAGVQVVCRHSGECVRRNKPGGTG